MGREEVNVVFSTTILELKMHTKKVFKNAIFSVLFIWSTLTSLNQRPTSYA